jgi:hypothetical protein
MLPLEPYHLVVRSSASKTISERMVHIAQTMHRSYTDTCTVSKRKEVRFHMTHVTLEFRKVRPKWFLILWYVWHKLCTYLTSKLALSPNRPRFHLSLITKEYHRVRPKWFLSWWYVWRKLCTYLALTLKLSPNRKKWDSTWPTSPRNSIGCVQNDFRAYDMFDANRAPILRQDWHYFRKGPKQASTWALSPSGTIKCVQNDFWAYGTSSANHALTFHRH